MPLSLLHLVQHLNQNWSLLPELSVQESDRHYHGSVVAIHHFDELNMRTQERHGSTHL